MNEITDCVGTFRTYVDGVMGYNTQLRRDSLDYFLAPLFGSASAPHQVSYNVTQVDLKSDYCDDTPAQSNIRVLMRDVLLLTAHKVGDTVEVYYTYKDRLYGCDALSLLHLLMGVMPEAQAGSGALVTQVAVSTHSGCSRSAIEYDGSRQGLLKGSLHYTIPVIHPCISSCNTLLGPIFWYERICAMEGSTEMTAQLIHHYKRSLKNIAESLVGNPDQQKLIDALRRSISARYAIATV